MRLNDNHVRTTAYIRRVVWTRRNARKYYHGLVQKIKELLAQMEWGDPGLTSRIEEALVRFEFQGSKEQETLQLAIDSALNDPAIITEPEPASEDSLGRHDPTGGESPELIADREERKAILQSALERELAKLPELERRALVGVYWEGKSQADVARERGVPASTLNDAYKRAISKLARRLDRLRDLYTPSR